MSEQKEMKRVAQSRVEQVQIVQSAHTSGTGRLFGGQLMAWVDIVAAVVARRHSAKDITTASIDNLNFKAPAFVDDTILLRGLVTYVGRTSMEVRVETYIEAMDGSTTLVNRAYLVMVALDENGNPTPVPGLIPETEEEKQEWLAGERRKEFRKQREQGNF